MVAWWSATFPGFGHYLLNQYLRGTLLTLSELFINSFGHVNEAMVYSFCGQFAKAKAVLHPDWIFGYVIIYFFAIWDSYRSTLTHNSLAKLAGGERPALPRVQILPMGIQYLERRKPAAGVFYTILLPGLGQLYNHRFGLAFYGIFWWWVYAYFSHVYTSMLEQFVYGNEQLAVSLLDPQWLLFMPSVMGGSVYHAYITTIEHNELFRLEQRRYLKERFKNSDVVIIR